MSREPGAVRTRRSGAVVRRLCLGAALLTLAACAQSVEGTKDAFEDDRPAGTLYNEGLAYLNAGKMNDARKSFDEVDRQHPYSDDARKALIMSAFASYRSGKFDETVASASRYLSLYPGSPDAAYAQYLIGQCYFKQIPDVTRDQAATKRAIAAMDNIVANYPDSEYAADAKLKANIARDQLAGKEMQVGRYYLERREYIAAINRFKTVVTDYRATRHVEEALERLAEANMALGLADEAQTAAAILGHNYPDSPWYQDAYKLLRTGGLEPRENTGSWLSKLFGGGRTT
jgi:outer membrane protein assembly factor BamD